MLLHLLLHRRSLDGSARLADSRAAAHRLLATASLASSASTATAATTGKRLIGS
jgi:hypothetical protein